MCFDPISMAAMASAALGAVGSIASAKAQQQQANYNAQVAEINAKTARQQGQAQADKIEDQYSQLAARQRVAASKAGLDPTAGSAALIINNETTQNSWLDQMNTIWSKEVDATGFENKAKSLRAEGKAAMTAGWLGAGSSILGGMAKLKPQIS